MKQKVAPLAAALVCALLIHVLMLELSDSQHWFEIDTPASNFELFLLPSNTNTPAPDEATQPVHPFTPAATEQTAASPEAATLPEEMTLPETTTGELVTAPEAVENLFSSDNANTENRLNHMIDSETTSSLLSPTLDTQKPALLDLSQFSLSADTKDEALTGVFSKELRDKIKDSKQAQKEYLNSLTKEVDYPITKDADGTRYVNIKGVCWRLPKEGSNEGWAIVFDGCGVKSTLFHFELNISPSVFTNELLGPDSPFNLDQPAQ
ncbi:hypothetical protein HGG82_15500 [Marinomonas sp. M1K-6]|uniref:Uncharacterized protein n=1 Tax=Marinomonas profundi TaxID=2726122 RepID=A0A847R4S9_9GAMM|nr:hypothetical protein [Marinomonas profundi]NLQ19011.1 hypothetical protein [Marinomonas profundi]UDV02076.1 hypothetical protein J8N69_10740 [Marinomonas profundi]